MDTPLPIAFLWHHHQPLYRVNKPGERPFFKLPWVRLHAVKDYYDMAALLKEYPAIRQNFNFVPSLLDQILDYVERDARDRVMELTLVDAAVLTEAQMAELLDLFFLANRATMIDPFPRFSELLRKKEKKDPFETEDWRDLQVWYNLCWIGRSGMREDPIASLLGRGRYFSEADKHTVLNFHRTMMARVIPAYRALAEAGQAELSVTPFYHPIIPLLCDSGVAGQSERHVLGEQPAFSGPEDADHQIHAALEYFKNVFGFRPEGMWPSEGAVSEEACVRFAEHGVRWIATDEAILYHSQTADAQPTHLRPYRCRGGPVMFFRDHGLSDAIGFVYAKRPAQEAVKDFIDRSLALRSKLIRQGLNPSDHLLPIVLDGENCWEYYPEQGEPFLRELFSTMQQTRELRSVTLGEFLNTTPNPVAGITKLHSGSWINHNFDIWFGTHREKNTAWQYLAYARETVIDHQHRVTEDRRRRAWEAIYTAEGSDWFWWFGDDHRAHNKQDFDELFRFYLRSAYDALDVPVPSYLRAPIMTAGRVRQIHTPPSATIRPRLDGKPSHFYEWQDAGVYDAEADGDTMHATEQWIRKILYGFDESFLYLRIDFFENMAQAFRDDSAFRIRVEIGDGPDLWFDGQTVGDDAVLGEIFEARIKSPEAERPTAISVSISVWHGEREIVRRPAREPLLLSVPSADSDKYFWSV